MVLLIDLLVLHILDILQSSSETSSLPMTGAAFRKEFIVGKSYYKQVALYIEMLNTEVNPNASGDQRPDNFIIQTLQKRPITV
jgi:hypothetical protein